MNHGDRIQQILDNLIWVILGLTALVFAGLAENFLTTRNLINILVHSSVLGIMVIGQTFTLLTGNFDLSMESTLAFTATIGAWLMLPQSLRGLGVELDPWLVVPIMLLIGAAIGLFNGILITKIKMNNFIVTLAMLIILRGAVYIWTGGNTYVGLPESFAFLGGASIGVIPVSVIAVIAAFAIAHVVVTYRVFGRELYAVGGNRDAAFTAGINVDRTIVLAYVVSGTLAAVSGWMLAGRLESVIPKLGEGMIFEVFAAAVIGGVSLQGGRGSMIGAFGGVMLLSVIDSGLNLMQVSPFWINAIRGLTILVAMFLDSLKLRYRGRGVVSVSPATSPQGVSAN